MAAVQKLETKQPSSMFAHMLFRGNQNLASSLLNWDQTVGSQPCLYLDFWRQITNKEKGTIKEWEEMTAVPSIRNNLPRRMHFAMKRVNYFMFLTLQEDSLFEFLQLNLLTQVMKSDNVVTELYAVRTTVLSTDKTLQLIARSYYIQAVGKHPASATVCNLFVHFRHRASAHRRHCRVIMWLDGRADVQ